MAILLMFNLFRIETWIQTRAAIHTKGKNNTNQCETFWIIIKELLEKYKI